MSALKRRLKSDIAPCPRNLHKLGSRRLIRSGGWHERRRRNCGGECSRLSSENLAGAFGRVAEHANFTPHSTNLLPWTKTVFLVVSLAIFFAAFFDFFGFVAFWYLVRLRRITESVRCRDRDRFNNVVDRIDKLLDYVFIPVAHGSLQISNRQTNDFCRR